MSAHFQSRQQPQQDDDGQRGHQGGKPPMPQGIIDLSPGHTNSSKPEFPISTPRLYTNRLLVSSPDRRGGLAGPSRFVLAVCRKSPRNTSTSAPFSCVAVVPARLVPKWKRRCEIVLRNRPMELRNPGMIALTAELLTRNFKTNVVEGE